MEFLQIIFRIIVNFRFSRRKFLKKGMRVENFLNFENRRKKFENFVSTEMAKDVKLKRFFIFPDTGVRFVETGLFLGR